MTASLMLCIVICLFNTKGRFFIFLNIYHLSNLCYHQLQTVSTFSEVPRFNQVLYMLYLPIDSHGTPM